MIRIIALLGLFVALPAHAVLSQNNPADGLFVSFASNDPWNVIGAIVVILLGFAGTVAMLFVMYGGMQYIFSGANEDLAKRGRTTVTSAVIGLIIILLSYTIITVVISSLENPGGAGIP